MLVGHLLLAALVVACAHSKKIAGVGTCAFEACEHALLQTSSLPAQTINILLRSLTHSHIAAALAVYPGGHSHQLIMSKFGRELVSRGHEFVYVHSNLDALNKNDWTGLNVLQYQAPMTEPEWDAWTVQLSTIDPIGGVKIIFEVQESFCKALVADKAVLESLRGADAFIADSAFPCGTFIADLLAIPVRVDFSAVGVSGQR